MKNIYKILDYGINKRKNHQEQSAKYQWITNLL